MGTRQRQMFNLILVIATIVVVGVGLALSVYYSFAKWSDASGGDTSVAPSITTETWGDYEKYFIYDAYDGNGLVQANVRSDTTFTRNITYFVCVGLNETTTREDVIFPDRVHFVYNGQTGSAPLRTINNTVFSSTTMKQIPTRVVLSPSINRVEAGTFSGLINLKKLEIHTSSNSDTSAVVFGIGAFDGCTALEQIIAKGQRTLRFSDNAFIGCISLSAIHMESCRLAYIPNMEATGTIILSINDNWNTIFVNCPKLTSFPTD